ncbi:MAG: hypothetical protein NZ608_07065 [candidate division WOR-3 bacterium]|nr:hypothetical protein [candidate division WOR-3 bacterium]
MDLKERIESRYNLSKKFRQSFERRWQLALASQQGQFLVFTSKGFVDFLDFLTRKDKRVEWKKLINCNLLHRIFTNFLVKFFSIPPSFIISPSTIQTEDVASARVAQKIVDGVITPKLEEVLYDLYFWMLWVDTTLLKVGYDETAGEPLYLPEITYNEKEGIPYEVDTPFGRLHLKDAKGRKLYIKKIGDNICFYKVPNGDLVYRVIPPFNYYIDPNAKGINCLIDKSLPTRAKWIIIEEYWDRDTLENKGFVEKDFKSISKTPVDEAYASFLEKIGLNLKELGKQEFYCYREYYEVPSSKYPDGLFVKMIGDEIVSESSLPEPFRRMEVLPFIDFRDNPKPYLFYGRTSLYEARELNKIYLQILSKIIEISEKMGEKVAFMEARGGTLKTYIPEGASVIKEVFDVPATSPQPFITEIENIPLGLLRVLDILLMNIEYLTATHDVKYPVRERTATEIIQTIMSSEQAFDPIKKMIIQRLIKACQYGLEVIKEFYPTGRKLEIGGGEYSIVEVLIFDKEELKGRWNIRYALGDLYTMTKTNRLLLLRELLQIPGMLQVLNPQTILSIINMREFIETVDTQLDIERQRRENLEVMFNPEVRLKVEDFDNHLIHIEQIDKFLKQNYDRLNSLQIQILKKHREEHSLAYMEQIKNIQNVLKEGKGEQGIESKERKEIGGEDETLDTGGYQEAWGFEEGVGGEGVD